MPVAIGLPLVRGPAVPAVIRFNPAKEKTVT